ncbi:MAG: hypothetical protein COV00_00645 [Candidatus Tagabacteria bacterium CG10_big_fil_rev_8_21_14_0_10_40_13]|uniref:HTH deoR-type domain-containing protein n=1 Tax=Candidatus Tagabacteria bacterium CG10_big_fil_rev_8_21_14_0_10_40_13 TaxID=1975022 RepID=A0A2M8L9I5_9BACT|nr:MAG: hypothetical protein COV00_00645 [Candidatus Tagabacteria bacterium CG10_big_fil_rev_8_21_14_0_10_40_13]
MRSQYFAYICDRVQKITGAVYRVTELLSEKEPLRWKIRQGSLEILTDLISLSEKDDLEKNHGLEKIESQITKLIVFFSLLSGNNSISGFNFEVLKEEYDSIRKSINQEKQSEFLGKLFTRNNLGLSVALESPKKNKNDNGQSNGQANEQNVRFAKARKDKIFNIVKTKRQINVSDLSADFPECSEKTLQRDLLEMVNKGLLKKEGEKRWRRYTLI